MGNTFTSGRASAEQSRTVQRLSSSVHDADWLCVIAKAVSPTNSAINQCVCMCMCLCVAFHMVPSLLWPAGRLQGGQEAKSPPSL